MKRTISLIVVVALLVLGAVLLAATAFATDPAPQTVVDSELVNLATRGQGFTSDYRLETNARWYGVADIYLTAALSETDLLTLTVQHSPDGTHAWVGTNVYTFTTAAAPDVQHVRVPIYGLALGVHMDISGSVRHTPTVYVVLKNSAGE